MVAIMIKDVIGYNNKEYQLSTVNLDGMLETMIFPIEDGVVSGREVYCFRNVEAGVSYDKHKDIYYNPEKYLSNEAIVEYMKSKEEDFEIEETIQFPFQFLNMFCNGEISLDDAAKRTADEVDRLIREYVETHNLKT